MLVRNKCWVIYIVLSAKCLIFYDYSACNRALHLKKKTKEIEKNLVFITNWQYHFFKKWCLESWKSTCLCAFVFKLNCTHNLHKIEILTKF